MRRKENNTPPSSRLSGLTDSTIIRRLEHETDRLLIAGLFVAVIAHSLLAVTWTTYKPAATALRPVEMQLRIIPPRMTKPFHISKTPLSHRRRKRQTAPRDPSTLPDADYSMPGATTTDEPYPTGIDSLAADRETWDIPPDRYVYDQDEPGFALPHYNDRIDRYSGKVISLKEELLTIDDLDHSMSDQFKGMLITNPDNPEALTGYLYIPSVYVMDTFTASMANFSGGIIHLAEAITSYTGINAKVDRQLPLTANTELRAPFMYIGVGRAWEYFPEDVKAVRDYLYSGGFVMFENRRPWDKKSPAEASLRQFIKDVFGSRARLEILPNSHKIYSNLFQFEDGPPLGAELKGDPSKGDVRVLPVPYLEGLYLNGRLAAIYSNKGYGLMWREGNDPQRKMTVNIVLYAMSQLGGKAVRKTDYALSSDIRMTRSLFQPIHKERQLRVR